MKNLSVSYDIKQFIGGIGKRTETGFLKEVNIVSWNEGPDKIDIRDWNPDHSRMTRGITLYPEEAKKLCGLLQAYFADEDAKND